MNLQIRWMIRRDMPEVLQIERDSFVNYWLDEDFLSCLRQRNCIGMIAEDLGQKPATILGFMVYELHKGHLVILNFAVAPACRRQGVGRAMVQRLIDKLSQQRRTTLELMLRESNLDAQYFFRALGFKAVDLIREHYDDTDEDGYLMQYRLPKEVAVARGK